LRAVEVESVSEPSQEVKMYKLKGSAPAVIIMAMNMLIAGSA